MDDLDQQLRAQIADLRGRPFGILFGPAASKWMICALGAVHCQGGYRASVAASLLQAAGHDVTAVDDDFSHAASAGLTVTGAPRRAAVAAG